MQQEQEKYDPVILNLSKSREITQSKNYLWLFLSSLLLLGVLLGASVWYFLTYSNTSPPSGTPSGAVEKPTIVAESTPVPSVAPSVTAIPEETADVTADIQPTPEPEKTLSGYLRLNSFPEQADVIIDGKVLGKTPLKDYELAEGDYSVTFSYNERLFTHTFSIKAGEITEYIHRFEGFGSLQIDTTSSSCEVYVNGQLRGKSPLLVEGLSPGEYTIVLKKIGYHTTEERVSLGKGEHQELFLTVKRLGSRSSSGTVESPSRPLHPSERLQN